MPITCPKCRHVQDGGDECEGCGVVFAKTQARRAGRPETLNTETRQRSGHGAPAGEEPKFCTSCGSQLAAGSAFCHACGARQPQVASQQAGKSPAGAIVPTGAAQPVSRKRPLGNPSFFVIVGGLLVLVLGAWFSGIGADIKGTCSVNGLGEGRCDFTNSGLTPGRKCVTVSVLGGTRPVTKYVCSGRVPVQATQNVEFQMPEAPADACPAPTTVDWHGNVLPVGTWTDTCRIEVTQ